MLIPSCVFVTPSAALCTCDFFRAANVERSNFWIAGCCEDEGGKWDKTNSAYLRKIIAFFPSSMEWSRILPLTPVSVSNLVENLICSVCLALTGYLFMIMADAAC